MRRKRVRSQDEAKVLLQSRRRCAFCFGLSGETSEKIGQIAHIDRNSENSAIENLAYLCMDHHDRYDSKTSQSKGLTAGELRAYRGRLYERNKSRQAPSVDVELEEDDLGPGSKGGLGGYELGSSEGHVCSDKDPVSGAKSDGLGVHMLPIRRKILDGKYFLRGINPDGSCYTGEAAIEREGDEFTIRSSITGEIFVYSGTLSGDILVVDGRHRVIYNIRPDGTLDGRWGQSGLEKLVPTEHRVEAGNAAPKSGRELPRV